MLLLFDGFNDLEISIDTGIFKHMSFLSYEDVNLTPLLKFCQIGDAIINLYDTNVFRAMTLSSKCFLLMGTAKTLVPTKMARLLA